MMPLWRMSKAVRSSSSVFRRLNRATLRLSGSRNHHQCRNHSGDGAPNDSPTGYVRIYNNQGPGQPVTLEGKAASRAETHFPLSPGGEEELEVDLPLDLP